MAIQRHTDLLRTDFFKIKVIVPCLLSGYDHSSRLVILIGCTDNGCNLLLCCIFIVPFFRKADHINAVIALKRIQHIFCNRQGSRRSVCPEPR